MANPPTRNNSFHDFAAAAGFPTSGVAGADAIMTSCSALTRMPGMPGTGKDGGGMSLGAVHAYMSRLTAGFCNTRTAEFDSNAFFRAHGISMPAHENGAQNDLAVTTASLDALANPDSVARGNLSETPSLANPNMRVEQPPKVAPRLARPSPFGEG